MERFVSLCGCKTPFQKVPMWLLQFFEESEITPEQKCVESFIVEKIGNNDELLVAISFDLKQLKDIRFVEAPEETCDNEQYSFRRRNGGLLLKAYLVLFNLEKSVEKFKSENKNIQLLDEIFTNCLFLNSSISGILMNYVFETGKFLKYGDHFIPNSHIQEYAGMLRRQFMLQKLLKGSHKEADSTHIKWCTNMKAKLDRKLIMSSLNFIKIQMILISLVETHFYDVRVQNVAKCILMFFKEILADTRIRKVVVESNLLFSEREAGAKTSTKLEIFFALDNMDCFCLRLDFSHKGIPYVHYNLHEPGRETGLPVKKDKKAWLINQCESEEHYNTLFFEHNELIWFRWDFLRKLAQEFPENSAVYSNLRAYFAEQIHFRVLSFGENEADVKSFLEAFADGLSYMELENCIYDKTKRVNIDDQLQLVKTMDVIWDAVTIYESISMMQTAGSLDGKSSFTILKDKTFDALNRLMQNLDYAALLNEQMSFEEMIETVEKKISESY